MRVKTTHSPRCADLTLEPCWFSIEKERSLKSTYLAHYNDMHYAMVLIYNRIHMLKIRDTAPLFALPNQDGKIISLSALRGNTVVLYFYPRAMTPGCTRQARGLCTLHQELAHSKAVAFGVSPDKPARLIRFREKESINFDLLSDEDHEIANEYGVWGEKKFMGKKYMGILRQTFIIDHTGRIHDKIEKVKTATHHNQVLDILRTM